MTDRVAPPVVPSPVRRPDLPSFAPTGVSRGLPSVYRLVRFTVTGGTAGAVQLLLLAALSSSGWNLLAAEGLALLIAAQLNFAGSSLFTWRDRRPADIGRTVLVRSWLLFHLAIARTACLNVLVFTLALSVEPPLFASALGIGIAGVINFLVGDRVVFRARRRLAPARRGTRAA